MKKIMKAYLKMIKLCGGRWEYRGHFKGKRLIVKQYRWLHFTTHPWESEAMHKVEE